MEASELTSILSRQIVMGSIFRCQNNYDAVPDVFSSLFEPVYGAFYVARALQAISSPYWTHSSEIYVNVGTTTVSMFYGSSSLWSTLPRT
jgi:hypothetical protein